MRINQNQNNTLFFNAWTDEQLHLLHEASLEILERTGVKIHDEGALEVLRKGGAWVKGNIAKIPAAMVEEAIRSAPSKVVMCKTDGTRSMQLARNHVYFGLGTDLPAFRDSHTKEIRSTVLDDVENVAIVTQTCDNIDFIASLGIALDVESHLIDLYHYKAMRTYCDKPIWMTAVDRDCLKSIFDMAIAQAGSIENFMQNPSLGIYNEPISPLVYSKEAIQKLMLCAEYLVPTTWSTAGYMGGTGPVTFAGTIALGNAEALGGLVIHQLTRKGAPFLLGSIMGSMDMSAMTCPYASKAAMLGPIIISQLARMYGLPSYGTGGITEANDIDVQAGIESALSNFAMAIGGVNLIHDNGYLGSGLVGSLEKIVLDNEVVRFIKDFLVMPEINDETLALDVIHEVSHGGEYASTMHTYENFRKEIFFPKFTVRDPYMKWQKNGCKNMLDAVGEHVRGILSVERKPIVSEAVLKRFDEIIEERRTAQNQ